MVKSRCGIAMLFPCILGLIIATACTETANAEDPVVHIGVLAGRGSDNAIRNWSPVAEYLTGQVRDYRFDIVPLTLEELYPTVEAGKLSFIIVNPSYYAEMQALYGVTRLATLKALVPGGYSTAVAGVVFCRSDRSDLVSLRSLAGKSFMAVDEASFGGWRMAWRELKESGVDPYRDFSGLSFAGTHDQVVYAVMEGKADAGAVAAPILEEMIREGKIAPGSFKVIHEVKHDGFPYFHSTRLYPERPFAKLMNTPDSLAEQVAIALMGMPAGSEAARAANSAGWTVPHDYGSVDECLKVLRVGVYKDYGNLDGAAIFRRYQRQIVFGAAAFCLLAGLLALALHLNKGLKLSKLALQEELVHRKEAEEEARHIGEEKDLILASAREGIFGLDLRGNITFANPAAARMVGRDAADLIGRSHREIVHRTRSDGSLYSVDERPIYAVLDGDNATTGGEEVFRRKDGASFPVEFLSSPLYEQGNLLGAVVTFRDITERREAEKALKESEGHYRSLFDNMLNGFAYCRMIFEEDAPQDFIYLNVNGAFELLTGLKDVIGKKVSEVIPGLRESDPNLFDIYGRVAKTGVPERFETYVEAMGMWFSISVFRPREEHFVAVFDVITERKRDEREREITIDFLHLVQESAGEEKMIRDAATFFQERSGCEAVGIRLKDGDDYPYYEAGGVPAEFVRAENSLCALGDMGEVIRDNDGYPILACMCGNIIRGRFDPSKPFFTRHGSFWTNCTTELLATTTEADRQARTRNRCNGEGYESVALIPLRVGNDKLGLLQLNDRRKGRFSPEDIALWERLAGYLAVALAKFHSEEMLRSSEAKFRSYIESVPVAIFVSNRQGRLVDFNPGATELLGYDAAALRNMRVRDLYPEEDLENISREFATLLETGHLETERRMKKRDGRLVWVSLHIVIISDQLTLGYCQDITERKRLEQERALAEAQLRQAVKMEALGTLAGGIAHDFNNILGVIVGYSEMIQADADDPNLVREDIHQVLKGARRAGDLVQQILAFSRHGEQERKPVRVGLIAKEVIKMLRAFLPSTIEIKQKVTSMAFVMADPTQIHQVLMNLCTNSVHAMGEGVGVLQVTLADVRIGPESVHPPLEIDPGPYVELSVKDTGQGIEPSILDRIFDPFFTTKEQGIGTGLGLSVVHGIVKSHGGAITVESLPGEGTTFRLFFPAIEAVSELPAEAGSPPPGEGERILVVDDEPALAMVVKRMLERLGYQVELRTNGMEALEAIRHQPEKKRFDLVITDLTMPNITGIDLFREIRKLQPDLPVILCTGFSEKIDAARAKGLGIQGFLMKPVALKDLAGLVREVLHQDD